MAGYSVTYTVVDEATAKIEAINRRIQQLRAPLERQQRALSQFVDATGLRKVAQGFDSVARSALSAFNSIGRIAPPLAAITSAASIAGVFKLTEGFADMAQALERNADTIGTTAQKLQTLQNAARLIGADVNTLTAGLKGLTEGAYAARLGFDPLASQTFARAGIALNDVNGKLRDGADLFPDVIRYLYGLENAQDRAAEATRLHASGLAEYVADLKASGISQDEAVKRAQAFKTITDEEARSLRQYRMATGALNVAFTALGTSIAAVLSEALTPLIRQFSVWIDNHQPQIIEGVRQITEWLTRWATTGGPERLLETLRPFGEVLGFIASNAKEIAEIFVVLWGVKAVAGVAALASSLGGVTTALAAIGAGGLATAAAAAIGTVGAAFATAFGLKWGLDKIFGPGPAGARASSRGGFFPGGIKPPAPAATPPPPVYIPGALGGVRVSPAAGAAPAAFKAAIEAEESRGGYSNTPTPGHSAIGPRQMEPGTFAAFAKPGERIDNPEDNRRVSDRYIDHLWTQYGGDPAKVAYAYANGSMASPDRNPGYAGRVMQRYGGGGGASAGGGTSAGGVNPQLNQAMTAAFQSVLPPGYTAKMTSGVRSNNPGSQHFTGSAEDWQVFDPQGRAIANRGEDTTGIYRAAAIAGLKNLAAINPELAKKFAWGRSFETSAGSGVADIMHYDIGGPRGRLSDPYEIHRAAAQAIAGGGSKGANGSVDVNITHTNAPPGVAVRAAGEGSVNLAPVRTQFADVQGI